jgi:hypothetical protein
MASNIKMAVALRNAILDAITTFAGGSALIKIYSGSQPTDGDTAIGAQVLLATLTCNATFAPGASSGTLTLNSISSDTSADATNTAAWFRMLKSDATTKVMDGTVGTSGCDINLNTTSIVSGATVALTSAVFTGPNA